MANNTFKLKLTNIGIFDKFEFPAISKNKTTLVFANNGSGKTTISRAFQLFELLDQGILNKMACEDYEGLIEIYGNDPRLNEILAKNIDENLRKFNKIIRFGADESKVSITVNNDSFSEKMDFKLKAEERFKIDGELNYRFYVFNSDYIQENIARFNYKLDGVKYILGQINVLGEEIEELEQRLQDIENDFEKLVEVGKEKLKKLEINISEYIPEYGKKISFSSIFKSVVGIDNKNYAELIVDFVNGKDLDSKDEYFKKICIAEHFNILDIFADKIREHMDVNTKIFIYKKQIKMLKDNGLKDGKKEKFNIFFQELLESFFGDKYKFDKKERCIKLKVGNDDYQITETLSDGEKSIIAFCYFIAEVKTRIDKNNYNKTFLVIDDPISSLDYNYVYHISSIISNIHVCFAGCSCLILTHNIDFYNMLTRNRIAKKCFTLKDKNIIESKDNTLVIPYFDHLKDIYIFKKNSQRRHTIANSMRYVLETLADFVYPHQTLQDLIKKLKNDKDFVRFIHDGSHGLFLKKGVSDKEQIIQYCDNIIDFISKELPEQHTWADKQADEYIKQLNAKEEKES